MLNYLNKIQCKGLKLDTLMLVNKKKSLPTGKLMAINNLNLSTDLTIFFIFDKVMDGFLVQNSPLKMW
jgi:hypothetical protein